MDGRDPVVQKMQAAEVCANWSALVDKVSRGETQVVVEEGGRAVVAIISARDLERFRQLRADRRERFKALHATWAAFEDVPDEELEREVERALAEVREANRRHQQQTTSTS